MGVIVNTDSGPVKTMEPQRLSGLEIASRAMGSLARIIRLRILKETHLIRVLVNISHGQTMDIMLSAYLLGEIQPAGVRVV